MKFLDSLIIILSSKNQGTFYLHIVIPMDKRIITGMTIKENKLKDLPNPSISIMIKSFQQNLVSLSYYNYLSVKDKELDNKNN